jgi:protein SCO1/2
MTGFRGLALTSPLPKPSFTLTDFNGAPYDFVRETSGKATLLFFGYTHCPDVCPVHMANIAAVLKTLSAEDRDAIRVVFVTTDPERDTPARLKEWLGAFDSSFVGLTGSISAIDAAQTSLGLQPARKEYPGADSTKYGIGHAAQVIAFARDGFAYLVYPFGIRQDDWARDLPKLARDASGEEIRRQISAQAGNGGAAVDAPPTSVAMRGFEIVKAVVAEPAAKGETVLYFTVRNGTPMTDTLVSLHCDCASMVTMHDTFSGGRMAQIQDVVVGPGADMKFEPGGRHAMVMGPRVALKAGDSVLVSFSFRRFGRLDAMAHIVKYADVQRALER